MPKSYLTCKLKIYASESGEKVFKVDANVFLCQLCECQLNGKKTHNLKIDKHIQPTKRHKNKIDKKQQFLMSYQIRTPLISIFVKHLKQPTFL
jgi:hypothetical protein